MFSSTKIMQALSPAAAVPSGYQISRSLRFNSADSAYLNRTPGTAGNRKTWTWSWWVKRSKLGTLQQIFSAENTASNYYFYIRFLAADTLEIFDYNAGPGTFLWQLTSTQVFRDVGSWYHIIYSVDTTQATASNRVKLYVNGSQVTAFSTANYPSLNFDTQVSYNGLHYIGRRVLGTDYLDSYSTEINFIDGQALTPSSFGETDATTGVWTPKAYTGTYGTNGFYLNFSDNSGTTATTLGKDSSGNGNNWTPNNFSVTAGVGNDSLVDSPTNYGTDTGVGGEVRGNYATYNPLQIMSSNPAFTNGNLDVTSNAGSWQGAAGSFAVTSGKWYWENTITAVAGTGGDVFIGIARTDTVFTTANPQNISGTIVYLRSDGHKRIDGTDTTYGATYTVNDVIGVALDMDASTVTFYKNNTSQGSISFSSSSLAGKAVLPFNIVITSPTQVVSNFGQRPFAYTAPSGFKALCTTNLSTPAVVKPNTNFDVALYTGTGSSLSVSSLGFQPDFTWIKGRSGATNHALYDAVRGVQKDLVSNSTSAETTETQGLTAFGSTGFTVGTLAKLNTNAATYAAWNWKANGAGSSNTSGTITSTVSANTTAGISVVTYTGNGTAGATVGHGIGIAPKFIIVKERSAVAGWGVYHASIGALDYLALNTTAAKVTNTMWNNTSPTTTVFSLGGSGFGVNDSTVTAVAYCFAEIAGFSRFGSYTGNGSADGPFVYCGFRPKFVMLKSSSNSLVSWWILDSARNTYNVTNSGLFPNLSNAENSTINAADFLSNGFKLRSADNEVNQSSGTYIFAAFAEAPFNYSRAR